MFKISSKYISMLRVGGRRKVATQLKLIRISAGRLASFKL